jgi:hypothetical protein
MLSILASSNVDIPMNANSSTGFIPLNKGKQKKERKKENNLG